MQAIHCFNCGDSFDFDPKSVHPSDNRPRPGFVNADPRPTVYGPEFVHVARPTQIISGTVRDKVTGKPLAGVTVNSGVQQGWWENAVYATTDFQGRYRVVGLPKTAKRQVMFFPIEGTPYLPAGFAVPEKWIAERRSMWERRLDNKLGDSLGE